MCKIGFLDAIDKAVLIGDGAIGTALFDRGAAFEAGVERLNLLDPDKVLKLHQDYIAAGSNVIETNTFAANTIKLARYGVGSEEEVKDIILAGVRLARLAAGDNVYVAGSLGPLPTVDGESIPLVDQVSVFLFSISALVEGGVDLLMLESFAALEELLVAVKAARSVCGLPVVAQMAFGSEGFTADGFSAGEVAERCKDAGADVVGANCGYGVHSVSKAIREMSRHNVRMSAYMNAGFPENVEGRMHYIASPEYLASRALDLAGLGVRLVGGCCGTGPEVISKISDAISKGRGIEQQPKLTTVPQKQPRQVFQQISCPLTSQEFPIFVELDPPRNLDISALVASAHALKQAGATAITIADNPLASVRMDNMAVAGVLQKEVEIPIVPHITGRDRNRIAIQSAIMGAHILGIRSLLCVTGDPVRMCQEPNTSGVFDLTSVGLVQMVADFNAGHRMNGDYRTEFCIGVALNPSIRTINGQIDRLKRKVDAGAEFALTQPIFDKATLDILQKELSNSEIKVSVYIGIMPLVSARNAEFLHNEVPGISIPDEIRNKIQQYESMADQYKAGVEIAVNMVESFADQVNGFYFICPRNKHEMVLPLVNKAIEHCGTGQ